MYTATLFSRLNAPGLVRSLSCKHPWGFVLRSLPRNVGRWGRLREKPKEGLLTWLTISKNWVCWTLVCENSRFSSLFAAEDVSRGTTSASKRWKFHTDDVKSVRNSVRSVIRNADWSTEWFYCFSYCLRMTDKRQKATKIKCKQDESLTKQSKLVEYILP